MKARRALYLAAALTSATAASTATAQWGQPPGQPAPQQPAQASAPPSTYDPSMQAGGLAPPPPMQPTAGATASPGATEQQLEEAKEKDSGRKLEFFWINVEGGFENVGLSTFNIDEPNLTAGFISTSANGPVIGAGLGLRLLFFTLGARGRIGLLDEWQLFSLGGEIGMHIPLGIFDPHVDLGFGYAGLGSFENGASGAADAIAIRGFYGRVSGGLDLYVTPVFSIGAAASWELLGLTRPGLSQESIQGLADDPAADPTQTRADLLALEGTSYGSALAITAVAGLHF